MAEIIITQENFDTEVLNSDKPVLVDFWASWCGPCQMLSPIISQIADEYADIAKVGKVNVDEEGSLARDFNIASIPTVMIFKNGEAVETLIGFRPKDEIVSLLKEL